MKRGDLVWWLVILVFLGTLALYETSWPALAESDSLFTAVGNVAQAGPTKAWHVVEFGLARENRTYRVRTDDPAVLEALQASMDTGNSVTAKVHLRGAGFVGASAATEFWVESFDYRGHRFGPFESSVAWSWRRLSRGEIELLHAMASLGDQRYSEAERRYSAALDAGLNQARRGAAFAGRAEALESLAYPPGREINWRDDELLVRATADYRRAAELDPDDPDLLLAAAYTLRSLGAYREALALYDEEEKRFPQRYFRIAISRGSTARQLGDYPRALRALDDLVAKHGPQDGMMYHYHRAQTLLRLERFADAIQEATAGIEDQPDYPWAFIARACARSRLDQPDGARKDLDEALRLLEDGERLAPSDYLAATASEVRLLRDAPGPGAPCRMFGREPGERHRERSARLR